MEILLSVLNKGQHTDLCNHIQQENIELNTKDEKVQLGFKGTSSF